VADDGSWLCLVPSTATTGAQDGVITATVTDQNGNKSPDGTAVLDTKPPAPPVVTQANGSAIKGTADASAVTVTVTYPTTTGQPKQVVVPVVNGAWSLPTPADAVDGPMGAVAKDQAGNASPTAPGTLQVTPPPLQARPSNGTYISGTTDPEPGLTVTVIDSEGAPIPGCEDLPVDPLTGKFECTPEIKVIASDGVSMVVTDSVGNQTTKPLELVSIQADVAYAERNKPQTQTVTGTNFNPGETVCLKVHSFVLDCGCGQADENGTVTFSFVIPDDFELGLHTAELTGEQSGVVRVAFTVTDKTVVDTGGTVVRSPNLALTGLAILTLLAAGGVLTLRRRVN